MNACSVTALREQSQLSATNLKPVDEAPQRELPLSRKPAVVEVPMELIRSRKNKGAAITLACDASGLDDKEISMPLGIHATLFSRIKAGSANLDDDLIGPFCRLVGNRVYPEWLAFRVGCTLVEIETETQRQLRVAHEHIAKQDAENALLRQLLQGRSA